MMWGVCKSYVYMFDTTAPAITLHTLHDAMWISGEASCDISVDKPGYVSIYIDGKLFVEDAYVDTSKHAYSWLIPQEFLSDGEHVVKISCVDRSYHANKSCKECRLYVDNNPLHAMLVSSENVRVLQGRTLHIKFQVNKEIDRAILHALAESYDCFTATQEPHVYECFIPISCEEKPNEYLFSVEIKDKVGNKVALDNKFEIVAGSFKKQSITIDPLKMKQEQEIGRDEAEFEDVIAQLTKDSPKTKLWQGSFCTPINVERVTCDFGTIRTSHERGRSMHKALDIINKPKSVVWSPQNGIVVLKDRFDFSGNTVVVDHGHGILSLFYHLDDFAHIEVGQKLAKGNPLGTLGKTGYATGYHLHWEMRVSNMQVDPMQWTSETF